VRRIASAGAALAAGWSLPALAPVVPAVAAALGIQGTEHGWVESGT
jgi:hypothetical protein